MSTITTVESIAELTSTQNPLEGQTVFVKSYHVGKGIGGGHFTYKAANASINDGGLIINGWGRIYKNSIRPEYFNNDFQKMVDAVPENSIIELNANSEYTGSFKSSKALQIHGNGATLKSNELGEFICFESKSIDAFVVESLIPPLTKSFKIKDVIDLEHGDLVVLWAGDMRDQNNPVNFETVKVLHSENVDSQTLVTLERCTLGHKEGEITARIYKKPIKNVIVKDIKYHNRSTSFGRGIIFKGCLSPFVDGIEVFNTRGHAISFEECYGAHSGKFKINKPLGIGSGEGYGIAFWKSSKNKAEYSEGIECRHIVDCSSAHDTDIEYVYAINPKASAVVMSHNGFCSNIRVEKVIAYMRTPTSIVSTSSQGFKKEINGSFVTDIDKRLKHLNQNLIIEYIQVIVDESLSASDSFSVVNIDTELGDFCKIGTLNVKFLKEDISEPTGVNAISIKGHCKNLNIDKISANSLFRPISITNIYDVNPSSCNIGLIDVDQSYYGVFNIGYDLSVEYNYSKIIRKYCVELVKQSNTYNTKKLYLKCYNKSNFVATPLSKTAGYLSGKISFLGSNSIGTAIQLMENSEIQTDELQKRNGYALLNLPAATTESSSLTINALPAPIFYNGERLTLSNGFPKTTGKKTLVIQKGTTGYSDLSILSGESVKLISLSGKWFIE